VIEVAGQWRAVRAVAHGIGYSPNRQWLACPRHRRAVWTYGDPVPHAARSGFRARLDMRVDGGTSPLPPVPVGAEILVYDRYADICPATVTATVGTRLTYRLAGADRDHHGQFSDVAEVVCARPAHPAGTADDQRIGPLDPAL
jgi:hypothetical protein